MKNKIISLLLLVLLTLTAVSCSQEVIFYDIAREVKLVDAEINGNTYSLVPLAGKLYVQNGRIFYKDDPSAAHGWKPVEKPEGSGNIIRLASDASFLYAMDATFKVWARASDGTWTQVATDVKALYDNQVTTDAGDTTGRTAYITAADKSVKQLDGANTPSDASASDTFARTGESDYIKAAVWNGSATVFSSNSIICANSTALYSADSSSTTIRYSTDGGANWTNGGTVDRAALSICTFGTDKILVGTTEGYQICALNATTKAPGNGTNSETNAESLIGNKRSIIMIKTFGQAVYAGVISETSSQYSKLWGYFGSSWNYE